MKSFKFIAPRVILLAALLACVVPAGAQVRADQSVVSRDKSASANAVKADLKQFLVQTENGREVFRPVNAVSPGDLIEYRMTYTNQSARPVRGVVAELPIPVGLEYQPRSAVPNKTAQFSFEAGNTYAAEPLMRPLAGGKKELVPYGDYRSVRWNVGVLAAGAKVEMSVRARVAKPESPKK